MTKDLIIVESPAKVKTIKKILGNKYTVLASVGHVRDLPTKELGVDEKNNFTPAYRVIEGKEKVVRALREGAAKATNIYLAPDPDREGEAIAWHVAELLDAKGKNIQRIQFNEITPRAVKEALEHPRELDKNLFDAQQARRILDRLVGYKLSPLLWNKVKRGISAGRVQSVALRLIVDREKEREAFVPEEYWLFAALLRKGDSDPFKAELHKIDGKKPVLSNQEAADALSARLAGQKFSVSSVEVKERQRSPVPPFITSTLQQAANQRHSYSAKRTMGIAQRLYEGVDLDDMGTTALITYMRTDSVRISDDARKDAQEFIIATYGKEYYPAKARFFRSKGGAQDAHEAIRPVDVTITPESIKSQLMADQYNLYRLIWTRFVASQMAAATILDTTILSEAAGTQWRTKGERVLFSGFLVVSPQGKEDAELPKMEAGDPLVVDKLDREQKFTQPPSRYSEASLVKELEERAIGRPSTYASIISTLLDREYTRQEEKNFVPTDLGRIVCDLLSEHFVTLMDVDFTAQMEGALDKVAEGDANWVELLHAFSADFDPTLLRAADAMESVKGGLPSGVKCPTCDKDMLIRFGKAGDFLACSGYPECKTTGDFTRDAQGNVHLVEREKPELEKVGTCPECGGDLVQKKARTGSRFIACTKYPDCKYTASFSTGVPCARCGEGEMVEKSSRRGKIFYSCGRYPQCDNATWDLPVAGTCPDCNGNLVLHAPRGKARYVGCADKKKCAYKQQGADEE